MSPNYYQAFERMAFLIGRQAPSRDEADVLAVACAKFSMTPEKVDRASSGLVVGNRFIAQGFPSARDIVQAFHDIETHEKQKRQALVHFLATAGSTAEILERHPNVNASHIRRIRRAQKDRRGGLEGLKRDLELYLDDPSQVETIAPRMLERGTCEKPADEEFKQEFARKMGWL